MVVETFPVVTPTEPELVPVCGYAEDGKGCISPAGHKGRHKLRPLEVPETEPSATPAAKAAWTPGKGDFVDLRGKMYLPARRRVQWMRQEPAPHPDWTIDTEIVEHERGKRVSATRVENGYACVRANVYDETGRLIATGLKTEYSENFPDYLEKCETGAIARALAVAGYGTESALDLDEGAAEGRIADAPVVAPSISASAVGGLARGGYTASANAPQIREVARLSRELGLDVEAIVSLINQTTGLAVDPAPEDPDARGPYMKNVFTAMSSEDIGKVVIALNAIAEAGLPVGE